MNTKYLGKNIYLVNNGECQRSSAMQAVDSDFHVICGEVDLKGTVVEVHRNVLFGATPSEQTSIF